MLPVQFENIAARRRRVHGWRMLQVHRGRCLGVDTGLRRGRCVDIQ